jgi:hypothetical protein
VNLLLKNQQQKLQPIRLANLPTNPKQRLLSNQRTILSQNQLLKSQLQKLQPIRLVNLLTNPKRRLRSNQRTIHSQNLLPTSPKPRLQSNQSTIRLRNQQLKNQPSRLWMIRLRSNHAD